MNSDEQISEDNGEEPENMDMYTPTDESESVDDSEDQTDESQAEDETADDDDNPVHWSYAEYIKRDKNNLWFVIFVIVVLGFVALDIFVLKTYFTFSALVIVMAIAIVVMNSRPPREVNYILSPKHGLYVGEKLHRYSEFKSFGVINDDGNNFIMLIPVKRFSVGVSVYFPTEVGEEIVDILGARLPMEQLKMNAIDVLVRKLHL